MAIDVLVTAGTTRELLDNNHYISTLARGELGVEISRLAAVKGYNVTLLYGFGSVALPPYVKTVRFTSNQCLKDEVKKRIQDTDIYISTHVPVRYTHAERQIEISSDMQEFELKIRSTLNVVREANLSIKPGKTLIEIIKDPIHPNLNHAAKALKCSTHSVKIFIIDDLSKIDQHQFKDIFKNHVCVLSMENTKEEIAEAIFVYIEKNLPKNPLRSVGGEKRFGRFFSDPPKNKKQIKKIIQKDNAKSAKLFETMFAGIIVRDIAYILEQGWANEISENDFFHGHGFVRARIPLVDNYDIDLSTIISDENVDLNYHTKEKITPRGSNWNIYSGGEPPISIDPNLSVRGIFAFHFNFQLDPSGPYFLTVSRENMEIQPISIDVVVRSE